MSGHIDHRSVTAATWHCRWAGAITMALLGIKQLASRSLSAWLRPASRPTSNADYCCRRSSQPRHPLELCSHTSGEVRNETLIAWRRDIGANECRTPSRPHWRKLSTGSSWPRIPERADTGFSNALRATGHCISTDMITIAGGETSGFSCGNLQINEGPPALADSGGPMELSVDHAPEPPSCRPPRRPRISAPLRAVIKEQPAATLPFRERK